MNRGAHANDPLDLAIRGSVGGRIVSSLAYAASRAWVWSSSRRLVVVAATDWQALEAPQKVRVGASVGAIAVVVHRTMSWLGPTEPLGAAVPVLVVVGCVVTWALAVPIAREWERLGR
jgi:uncharacterized oligopeptide transporter (OPT) family protein